MHIGENGTEQFTVTTYLDGEIIRVQPIHDPFIRSTTVTVIGRWDAFKAIFRRKAFKIGVHVDGSEGVQRAIMTMDPEKLQGETEKILDQRRRSREENGVVGLYAMEALQETKR